MVGIAIALALLRYQLEHGVQVGNRRAMLIGIRATVVLLQLIFMPSGITLVAAVVGLIVLSVW